MGERFRRQAAAWLKMVVRCIFVAPHFLITSTSTVRLTFTPLHNLPNMSNTLTVEKAESLVRLMTDGLVNIVDKTGEFLLKRESFRRHVGQY